jgi:hypothetical protein
MNYPAANCRVSKTASNDASFEEHALERFNYFMLSIFLFPDSFNPE